MHWISIFNVSLNRSNDIICKKMLPENPENILSSCHDLVSVPDWSGHPHLRQGLILICVYLSHLNACLRDFYLFKKKKNAEIKKKHLTFQLNFCKLSLSFMKQNLSLTIG